MTSSRPPNLELDRMVDRNRPVRLPDPDPRGQVRALRHGATHPDDERRSRIDRDAGEPDDQIDSADSTVSPGDERSRSVAIVRGPLTSAQPIAVM
jgi:hypothetical protein